jgi:large subunit ribosomal protein L9
MKVILLRDVARIGKRFEIKEVPDGFALNKLIPARDAEPATPANVKRVMEKHKNDVRVKDVELATARSIAEACAALPITIAVESNEQGHLFQAIHAKDIVTAAAARGLGIPEGSLKITAPIKSLGQHTVILHTSGQDFNVPLSIVAKSK